MYSGIKYLFHPIMACQRQNIIECQVGFPIRKSAGQRVLSPRRGLSQSATSFIASYRQGIHQTPFSRLIRASESMTLTGLIISRRPLGRRCLLVSVCSASRTMTRGPRKNAMRILDLERLCSAACPVPRRVRAEPGLVSRNLARTDTCRLSLTWEIREHVSCFSLFTILKWATALRAT